MIIRLASLANTLRDISFAVALGAFDRRRGKGNIQCKHVSGGEKIETGAREKGRGGEGGE